MAQQRTSRHVADCIPPPGSDPVADAIRERRGTRGITPLDAALLHFPPGAAGWNSLLGAVRTSGKLSADVREIMILRIAALNKAALEWIHHEPVARDAGVTTSQLYIIRDIATPLPPSLGVLSPLQTAALLFADASTRSVRVPDSVSGDLKKELQTWLEANGLQYALEDLYVEAAMVVGAYNMVSRFLLSVDVAGMADDDVPWPLERREHTISLPVADLTCTIEAITLVSSPTSPWVAFSNSLLTNMHMWDYLIPYLLSGPQCYNIILHAQRGHGRTTMPPSNPPLTSIRALADDISLVLHGIGVPTPIHALVGVSQGGAAALAVAALYPNLARGIVACDTAAITPAGNASAWEERIGLVYKGSEAFAAADAQALISGAGMARLAGVTVPRWFPLGSSCFPCKSSSAPSVGVDRRNRGAWIARMVGATDVRGFVAGARGLSDYDIIGMGLVDPCKATDAPKVLLLAGGLDGGGKVGLGMEKLAAEWQAAGATVEYAEIKDAGHLPMVDNTEMFWTILDGFLGSIEGGSTEVMG